MWGRYDETMYMHGSVIGDKGVLSLYHTAPLLIKDRLMELPDDTLQCKARLFANASLCAAHLRGDNTPGFGWFGQFTPRTDEDTFYSFT